MNYQTIFVIKKIAIGRKAALSLVVGFNQTDASIGWFHFLSGLTLYYSQGIRELQHKAKLV